MKLVTLDKAKPIDLSSLRREDVNPAIAERDKLIAEAQRDLFEWIPLKMYQLMLPTETTEAIYARVHRGTWRYGVEVKKVPGMGIWVNLKALKLKIEG